MSYLKTKFVDFLILSVQKRLYRSEKKCNTRQYLHDKADTLAVSKESDVVSTDKIHIYYVHQKHKSLNER